MAIAVCSVFGCSINNACATTQEIEDSIFIKPGNYKDQEQFSSAALIYTNTSIAGGVKNLGPLTFQRTLLQLKQDVKIAGDISIDQVKGVSHVIEAGNGVSLKNVSIKNSTLLTNTDKFYGNAYDGDFFHADSRNLSVNAISVENCSLLGEKHADRDGAGIKLYGSKVTSPVSLLSVKDLSYPVGDYHADLFGVSLPKSDISQGVNRIDIRNVTITGNKPASDAVGLYLYLTKGKIDSAYIENVSTDGGDAYGISTYLKKEYGHLGIEEVVINNLHINQVSTNHHQYEAYGIYARNLDITGDLYIDNIVGAGNSYAIYANGIPIDDKEHKGIRINMDELATVRIRGDILSERFDSSNFSETYKNTKGRISASFTNEQSYFEGATIIKDGSYIPYDPNRESAYGRTDLKFSNGAKWNVTGDSYVTNLTVRDGATVDVNYKQGQNNKYPGHANSIMIRNLETNRGTFVLDYDHIHTSKINHLNVLDQANGTVNLVLNINNGDKIGISPEDDKYRWRYLIAQKGGKLTIGDLKFKPGAARVYDVSFWEEGKPFVPGMTTSTGNPGRWVVTNGRDAFPLTPIQPAEPIIPEQKPSEKPEVSPEQPPSVKPDLPLEPDVDNRPSIPVPHPEKPAVTPEVNQIISLSASVAQGVGMLSEMEDLRTRMGDIKNGATDGLWARTYFRKDRAYGSFGNGFEQDTSGIHIGLDHVYQLDESSSWLLGGAFHYGRSDLEGARATGGGDAKVDQYTFKAYATYLHESGAFADIVSHVGYYDNSLSGLDNTEMGRYGANYSNWGYGISGEIGQRFSYGEWFVEPSAQLTWFHADGKHITTTTGLKIHQDDGDFITGRIGTGLGKTIALGNHFQPYSEYVSFAVKGGLLYQFNGDQKMTAYGTDGATVRCTAMDIQGARSYFAFTADWKINDMWRIYGQISREDGSGYTKDYDASISLRYTF